MGCFNTTGFISKLPIRCGDRVVCFIVTENAVRNLHELYIPDALIAPWGLPVRGKYDDYGSVEDIDRNFNVEIIEKITGTTVEKVFKAVERCLYGHSLEDNIKYWERADKEMGEHGHEQHEADKYYPLRKLYGFLHSEKSTKDYLKEMLAKDTEHSEEDKKRLLDMIEEESAEEENKKLPGFALLFEHEAIYDEITSKDIKWGWSWDAIDMNEAFNSHLKILDLEDEARKIIRDIEATDESKDTDKYDSTGMSQKKKTFPNIFDSFYWDHSPLSTEINIYTSVYQQKEFGIPGCPTKEQFDRLTEIKNELEELYEHNISFSGTSMGRSKMFMMQFKMLGYENYRKMLTECREETVRFIKLMIWLTSMPMVINPSKTCDQDYNPRGFIELYDYLHQFAEWYFEEDIREEENED